MVRWPGHISHCRRGRQCCLHKDCFVGMTRTGVELEGVINRAVQIHRREGRVESLAFRERCNKPPSDIDLTAIVKLRPAGR